MAARALVACRLDLYVEGLEHVPSCGPAILASRHYHHLYDAAAILASVPREVHIVVAVDWLRGWQLALMLRLAAAARWPAVWRDGTRINRGGYQMSRELLSEGRLLLMFPEGYPTVDPLGSHKRADDDFLPFDAGVEVLAERAGVPIVPVGLSYATPKWNRRQVALRLGRPLWPRDEDARQLRLQRLEAAVRALSAPLPR